MRNLRKSIITLAGTMFLAALCGSIQGQSLTTIQDTLFSADGSRFNGTLTVRWSTFDAANLGTVIQQSKNVQVVNGNLQMQLAPNNTAAPPANTYTVLYQSDGREQFTELWSVRASASPLAVSQVRVGIVSSGGSGTGGSGTVGNTAPLSEAAIVGLITDLNQRPIKGAGYGANAVAFVNGSGQLETVPGSSGDCVFVDGTSGPCAASTIFVDAEVPAGTIDGTNRTFTLATAPSGTSLHLIRNGLNLKAGLDYTLTSATILFATNAIPQPQDTLFAHYRVESGSAAGSIQLGVTSAQVLCNANGTATQSATWVSLGTCDIASSLLQGGDRIEIRFNFAHTGTATGFDVQVNWGSTVLMARHGSTQDSALVGHAEAAVSSGSTQLTVQSWGTVLPLQSGIVTSTQQGAITVDFRARMGAVNAGSIGLSGYTVIRYPGR